MMFAGCAHIPPKAAEGCLLPAYPLFVGENQPRSFRAFVSPNNVVTFSEHLKAQMSKHRLISAVGEDKRREVLILSGGSQNGAFGAGFFHNRYKMGKVPTYDVVTGVSTGALQSTFVFLANQSQTDPSKLDRRYPPYMMRNSELGSPGKSETEDLALAYAIEREGDLMQVSQFGIASVLFDGSLASFKPIRKLANGLITDDTLRRVAKEGRKGRMLIVGVTNLNDGLGYAIDLTKLAVDAGDNVAAIRDCYVDALLASSSVPPGVPPVSLRTRVEVHDSVKLTSAAMNSMDTTSLYIDGGVRYGVFFHQLRDTVSAEMPSNVTLIVNGGLFSEQWKDENGELVEKWSALNVGMRAVSLLTNQIYRFSVDSVENYALEHGELKVAFISNQNLTVLTTSPEDWPPDNENKAKKMKCAEAFNEDKRDSPQEFHAGYMRCLLDYGQARATKDPWNKIVPPKPPSP